MAFVALLDANVLYPAYLRDLLLRLDRWTAQLQRHPDTLEERLMTTVPEFSRAVLEYVRREGL